jgi:hypothetical protein
MANRRTQPEALVIRWKDASIRGCRDVFELGALDPARGARDRYHTVRCPGKWEGRAYFRLTVDGRTTTLDYSVQKKKNLANEMEPGVMTLEFNDADRVGKPVVYWQDDPEAEMDKANVEAIEVLPGQPLAYKKVRKTGRRRTRDFKDRPGRSAFRAQLRQAYDDRCCITGCGVGAVLDAAHIDQYIDLASDAPSNGLLLRKDVHLLFDLDLLGVEPESRTVHLSKSLKSYADLETGRPLLEPRRGWELYGPATEALRVRWKDFQKAERSRAGS